MSKKDSQLILQVEVGSLSSMMSMPTGAGVGYFNGDGSFQVILSDTRDLYEGGKGVKVVWNYGLMKGVDEEHIYIGIGLMVHAKIIEREKNTKIEEWLKKNHPK